MKNSLLAAVLSAGLLAETAVPIIAATSMHKTQRRSRRSNRRSGRRRRARNVGIGAAGGTAAGAIVGRGRNRCRGCDRRHRRSARADEQAPQLSYCQEMVSILPRRSGSSRLVVRQNASADMSLCCNAFISVMQAPSCGISMILPKLATGRGNGHCFSRPKYFLDPWTYETSFFGDA